MLHSFHGGYTGVSLSSLNYTYMVMQFSFWQKQINSFLKVHRFFILHILQYEDWYRLSRKGVWRC